MERRWREGGGKVEGRKRIGGVKEFDRNGRKRIGKNKEGKR